MTAMSSITRSIVTNLIIILISTGVIIGISGCKQEKPIPEVQTVTQQAIAKPAQDLETDTDSETPAPKPKVNTKKERGINASLQAIEAQLRYWGNEEKQKVKDYEDAPQMSRIIGQNVQKLWLEKLELQETARNLNINLVMPLPKKKRPEIKKEEE
jgi:negative regulator of sigma E activity